MARVEADREDLFAEAVVLTRRLEAKRTTPSTSGESDWLVAGIRESGAVSIYLGPDCVYHWDDAGRLRRAYLAGDLYRTQGMTLSRLRRERSDIETALVRHDLSASELVAFQSAMHLVLGRLMSSLGRSDWTIVRQIPSDDARLLPDILARIRSALSSDSWIAPAIPGKR